MNYAFRAVEGVKSSLVAIAPRPKAFLYRIPVQFTKGHFTVKTIENRRELWQVYKLRYEVFHREYKQRKFPFGVDKDRYDHWADHLAIIDNRIGKIVGTYRLIRGVANTEFYSASEFNLKNVELLEGCKVELSRACIHKSYRNGTVITLLWRGICEYVASAGVRWLFGMGSIRTIDHQQIAGVFKQLQSEGCIDSSLVVPAIGKYSIQGLSDLIEKANVSSATEAMVPPLVRSYLKAGAIVGTDVAIDRDFNCADLFLVLDMTRVAATFAKRFQIH